MKQCKNAGFTLVELLIVIALIAILSVAVLATINPIEQSNKARDAQVKNDAAEILGAYERYYASSNSYPWGQPSDVGPTVMASNDLNFGIVDAAYDPNGKLITTSELKSSFAGKAYFTSGVSAIDTLYAYNNGSDSNYVCFVPKARANRALTGMLRCVTQPESKTDTSRGVILPGAANCDSVGPDDSSWTGDTFYGSGKAHFMCVPETASVTIAPSPTP